MAPPLGPPPAAPGRGGGGVNDTKEQAITNFVQKLKDDGSWDLIESTMLPDPDGPLNKADMEAIWARRRQPVDTGLIFSIGPAVDLIKLKAAMDEFSREPWDLPPPHANAPTPTPEPPTDD